MATGLSLHVGVNVTQAVGIDAEPLEGCENDARTMLEISRSRGFIHLGDDPEKPVIGSDATYKNVLGKIHIAAKELNPGDIFLFTFAGHGTRQGDEDSTEEDFHDETLVLHDRLLIDNVLRRLLWPAFKPGVRVIMVSDSCHSGGAAMSVVDSEIENSEDCPSNGNGFRVRGISPGQAKSHMDSLKEFYAQLKRDLPATLPDVAAQVLLLAACEEHQRTRDGKDNGVFTKALLDVWNTNGSKTYEQLMNGITDKLSAQDPKTNPVMVPIPDTSSLGKTEAFRI
jgi:metacaspase-1